MIKSGPHRAGLYMQSAHRMVVVPTQFRLHWAEFYLFWAYVLKLGLFYGPVSKWAGHEPILLRNPTISLSHILITKR